MELHKRTWARILSYRILAIALTAVWTGLTSAVEIHLGLIILHYIVERVWIKVSWGRIKTKRQCSCGEQV